MPVTPWEREPQPIHALKGHHKRLALATPFVPPFQGDDNLLIVPQGVALGWQVERLRRKSAVMPYIPTPPPVPLAPSGCLC